MTKRELRAAFEAHARQAHLSLAAKDGRYIVTNTRDAFAAFKAAHDLLTKPTHPPVA